MWHNLLEKAEEGASAVEYALLVALIGIIIIAGAGALGNAINGTLNTAANTVSTGTTQTP